MFYALLGGLVGFVLGNVLGALLLGLRKGEGMSDVGARVAALKDNAEKAANEAESSMRTRCGRRRRGGRR